MSMTARLDPDGWITLEGANWSERFQPSALPAKIRFYRSLWAGVPVTAPAHAMASPGPRARFYKPTLDALTAIATELGQMP